MQVLGCLKKLKLPMIYNSGNGIESLLDKSTLVLQMFFLSCYLFPCMWIILKYNLSIMFRDIFLNPYSKFHELACSKLDTYFNFISVFYKFILKSIDFFMRYFVFLFSDYFKELIGRGKILVTSYFGDMLFVKPN